MSKSVLCLLTVLAAVVGCQTGAEAADGLVGHWKLDECEGQIAFDSTGNQNHGTVFGRAGWVALAEGCALYFNGKDGRIEIPHTPMLLLGEEMTLVLWVRLSRVAEEAYELVRKRDAFVLFTYVAGTRPAVMGAVFIGPPPSQRPQGASPFTYDEWHQIGFVFGDRNGDGQKTIGNIVNGRVVSEAAIEGAIASSTAPLVVNLRELHRGFVRDIRLYSRALSDQELEAVFREGATED